MVMKATDHASPIALKSAAQMSVADIIADGFAPNLTHHRDEAILPQQGRNAICYRNCLIKCGNNEACMHACLEKCPQ
ncbi:hypothetical protein Bca52824_005243 [Brassica carinata]|uniref:Uncharacterized protein n=1 Tax=Brassica carinata TaxID=52824 RepID=A0A8X7WTA2_BRACI|nr:hypothetical protein Bca52824_005243 [Brassica carinata]